MQIKYWRIGTDPSKYIENWLSFSLKLNLGDKLLIDDNKIYKINSDVVLFSANSNATFNQNIVCWETFGLCKKTGNNTIVILDIENQTYNEIVEKIKWNLLIKSKKKQCQILKNSIMIKILYIENKIPNFVKIEPIKSTSNESFKYEKLAKDIGKLDKTLHKDKIFVEAICKYWNEGEDHE